MSPRCVGDDNVRSHALHHHREVAAPRNRSHARHAKSSPSSANKTASALEGTKPSVGRAARRVQPESSARAARSQAEDGTIADASLGKPFGIGSGNRRTIKVAAGGKPDGSKSTLPSKCET